MEKTKVLELPTNVIQSNWFTRKIVGFLKFYGYESCYKTTPSTYAYFEKEDVSRTKKEIVFTDREQAINYIEKIQLQEEGKEYRKEKEDFDEYRKNKIEFKEYIKNKEELERMENKSSI